MTNEERYRIIAENTSDVIVMVDNDGIVRFVSPSIESIIGYSIAEYEGVEGFNLLHPDDRELVRLSHQQVVSTKLYDDLEYRVIHKQGHVVHVEARVKPVLDDNGDVRYVVAVVRDISKRKQTEQALEESEQRYKSLFENNLDGVFSIDLRGNFVSANRSFEIITGIELSKLTNRCFMGLIFDEDHSSVNEVLFNVMRQMEPRDIECRIQKGKLGETIVNVTFVPIVLSGELHGVHGIVKDISERKREERELILSEEKYRFLQKSITQFSNDLANVMKVSELEDRLVAEVKEVLQGAHATILEVPKGQEKAALDPLDRWVRLGQKQHPVYMHIELGALPLKLEEEWLDTIVHYAMILYDNLLLVEDLIQQVENMVSKNETPKWMLRLLFNLSEKERFSLSSDLHDTVLQDLIIWYRRLEALRSQNRFGDSIEGELSLIEEGLLDTIHQIRITCNELRPPFLLKMGLVSSLQSLFTYLRMFSNYEIEFSAEQFDGVFNDEQVVGIYRIVQELLNNASKHSKASKVTMSLMSQNNDALFSYSDDGVGIDLSAFESSFQHMGISGIENRVLSLGGKMKLNSSVNKGFHVNITIPQNTSFEGENYGNFVG